MNTKSDPLVALYEPEPTCGNCGRKGHTVKTCSHIQRSQDPEEDLFFSFLVKEEEEDEEDSRSDLTQSEGKNVYF